MNTAPASVDASLFRRCFPTLLCIFLAATLTTIAVAAESAVSITETDGAFNLVNQHISARINKRSGDLVSLKFQ
jgi:hypothetical protein